MWCGDSAVSIVSLYYFAVFVIVVVVVVVVLWMCVIVQLCILLLIDIFIYKMILLYIEMYTHGQFVRRLSHTSGRRLNERKFIEKLTVDWYAHYNAVTIGTIISSHLKMFDIDCFCSLFFLLLLLLRFVLCFCFFLLFFLWQSSSAVFCRNRKVCDGRWVLFVSFVSTRLVLVWLSVFGREKQVVLWQESENVLHTMCKRFDGIGWIRSLLLMRFFGGFFFFVSGGWMCVRNRFHSVVLWSILTYDSQSFSSFFSFSDSMASLSVNASGEKYFFFLSLFVNVFVRCAASIAYKE